MGLLQIVGPQTPLSWHSRAGGRAVHSVNRGHKEETRSIRESPPPCESCSPACCAAHRDESMAQPRVRQRLTSSISEIYSRAVIAISLSRSEALASNYPE